MTLIKYKNKFLLNSIFSSLGIVSFPAFANSNVQIFGVMDMGISHYKVSGGQSLTVLSDSGNTTNRIGFRGQEDLGNGVKVIFWLEGGFIPSSPANSFNFVRRSVVGFSGDFGQLTLGRDFTPGYSLHSTFGGPFGTNGVADNLVYRARVLMHSSVNANQSDSYVRSSNAITYVSPKTNGIYSQFMYSFNEQKKSKAGRYIGGRLGYVNKNFDISAAYNEVSSGETDSGLLRNKVKGFGFGASYSFLSNSKIVLLYVDDDVQMANGDKNLKGLSVGFDKRLGKGVLKTGMSYVRFNHFLDNSKAMKYSLGYVYDLSKRTVLYSSIGYIKNSKGAKFVVNAAVEGKANASSSGVDFGIRHNF